MSDIKENFDGEDTSTATNNSSPTKANKEFAPISRKVSNIDSRSGSRARSGSRRGSAGALSRHRSNNGYGCDEDNDKVEEATDVQEKDPYEVHWENGDSDPMNPRSRSKFRKWVIVLIVSASSLCV